LEGHPLRQKPYMNVAEVYDLTAQTHDRLKDKKASVAFLKRSVAATACASRFAGLEPLGEGLKIAGGDEAVAWSAELIGGGGGKGGGWALTNGDGARNGGGADIVTAGAAAANGFGGGAAPAMEVPAAESTAYEAVLRVGDKWKMQGGRPDAAQPADGVDEVGKQVYVLGKATRRFFHDVPM
jgi:hypothetical protein